MGCHLRGNFSFHAFKLSNNIACWRLPYCHPLPLRLCVRPRQRPCALNARVQGCSSIGRASVSKTEGRGFEPLRPCHLFGTGRVELGLQATVSFAGLS